MRFLRFMGWLTLGLVGLIVLAVFADEQSTPLEVRRIDNFVRGDGQGIEIVNIGQAPITIKKVQVNERAECLATPGFVFGSRGGDFPMTLKIGDKVTAIGSCRAIRVTIVTDKQSVSYSFQ
ncbi:hypothetical protein [Bradyrhizobium icense]|uniref:Uncharacterized protein n=1 Tax=Bradyrhizobium icense TaxID=1274631 RepID=A0A1B1UBG0_9BRAD|nr:hypothetical protein [Bradyrhizobium icense]ANW00083.1 hypothetical protein LMTR13_07690 [Bradyrhizobium icense]